MTTEFNQHDVRATYRFLAHEGRGITEVRLITPGRRGASIGYFDNEDDFTNACADANGRANVYIGTQPRPVSSVPDAHRNRLGQHAGAKDTDIEWLSSIVIDVDPERPPDTAASADEVGRALSRSGEVADWVEEQGYSRPVLNMSGNGCQLWFAVPPLRVTDANRAALTAQLKRFEARIRDKFSGGGVTVDSIYNLSRIIKVIGTKSIKGVHSEERPHRLSRSLGGFLRREDAKLLQAIRSQPIEDRRVGKAKPRTQTNPPSKLAPKVFHLINTNQQIRALFNGRGKPAIGENGRALDTTSSGYDYSLLLALIRKGITEPDDLASALWCRDGVARAKGQAYVERTVRNALERMDTGTPDTEVDFTVDKVVVYGSEPPIYELHIEGRCLRLTTGDLISPERFSQRFTDLFRRIPEVPAKKQWRLLVNGWLAEAETVEQPPEVSDAVFLLDAIMRQVYRLGVGEGIDDLEHGKAILWEGRRAFQIQGLKQAASATIGDLAPSTIGALLRQAKCEPRRLNLDGRQARVWVAPRNDEWAGPS